MRFVKASRISIMGLEFHTKKSSSTLGMVCSFMVVVLLSGREHKLHSSATFTFSASQVLLICDELILRGHPCYTFVS